MLQNELKSDVARFTTHINLCCKKKNALNLSVNVFTKKVLIQGRYINASYWRLPFYEGLAILQGKGSTFISQFF